MTATDKPPDSLPDSLPDWPPDLRPYRRTPEFDAQTTPGALQRAHSTRPGTWAQLHVLAGALVFRDLVSGHEQALPTGVHRVIFPERPHEVVINGPVRFFVEFCTLPDDVHGQRETATD